MLWFVLLLVYCSYYYCYLEIILGYKTRAFSGLARCALVYETPMISGNGDGVILANRHGFALGCLIASTRYSRRDKSGVGLVRKDWT
jgi:hypothetical protein